MLVANDYAPDPRVHKEALSLINQGYSVSVLCWDRQRSKKKVEVIDGVLVRRFRYLMAKGIASYTTSGCLFLLTCLVILLKETSRQTRIVVHCHDFNTLPVGWVLRVVSRRIRLVYDSHENFSELLSTIAPRFMASLTRGVERLMLGKVDALIAVNDWILHILQPYCRARGVAIYNAPPLSVLQSPGLKNRAEIQRLRSSFGADSFILLYYGAIIRHRGFSALLDAASLASKNPTPQLVFVIVGEGPLTSSLTSEIGEKKLSNLVKSYPHVPFARAMLMVKAADAVYIGFEPEDPNNYFASPNKLFEAMAMGTPVLASSFGLLGKLVRELGCGVTMDSVSGPSILNGIQKLLREDVRVRCAKNGQHWFKSRYNWNIMEQRLSTIYKNAAPIHTQSS